MSGYSPLAKIFHWVTVPLLGGALATGLVLEHIRDPDKLAFYAIHESLGVTIFFVALARLAWRRATPPPPLAAMPRPMRIAATAVHHTLYAALLAQPLIGFVMTNAFGFPLQGETAYLGFIDLPKFMNTWEGLGNVLGAVHGSVGFLLLVLIPAHVAGAIYHHAVRRDGTLLKMI